MTSHPTLIFPSAFFPLFQGSRCVALRTLCLEVWITTSDQMGTARTPPKPWVLAKHQKCHSTKSSNWWEPNQHKLYLSEFWKLSQKMHVYIYIQYVYIKLYLCVFFCFCTSLGFHVCEWNQSMLDKCVWYFTFKRVESNLQSQEHCSSLRLSATLRYAEIHLQCSPSQ